MPSPVILALALGLGLLVLVPSRRLQAAGFSAGVIGAYALILWGLGMVMAIQPVASRILVPILIVAYLAPFVASPDVVRRIAGRRGGGGAGVTGRGGGRDDPRRPPMKNVTPPDATGPTDTGSTR